MVSEENNFHYGWNSDWPANSDLENLLRCGISVTYFEQRPVLDPNQSSCAHSFLIKVTLRKSPKPFSISSLKSLRSSLWNSKRYHSVFIHWWGTVCKTRKGKFHKFTMHRSLHLFKQRSFCTRILRSNYFKKVKHLLRMALDHLYRIHLQRNSEICRTKKPKQKQKHEWPHVSFFKKQKCCKFVTTAHLT